MILFLLFCLSSCNKTFDSIENPQPELFSVFYEDDEYTILVRSELEKSFFGDAMVIESEKGYTCSVGQYHMVNYMILANGEYYNILVGAQMNLYTGNDLVDLDMGVSCKLNEE